MHVSPSEKQRCSQLPPPPHIASIFYAVRKTTYHWMGCQWPVKNTLVQRLDLDKSWEDNTWRVLVKIILELTISDNGIFITKNR